MYLNDRIINATYYENELQEITQDDQFIFRVDKILRKRGQGDQRECLIRWLGYPPEFDSWVKENTLQDI